MVFVPDFNDVFNSLFYNFPKEVKPPMDTSLKKEEDGSSKVLLQAALAGFNKEEIKVWYEDNVLLLTGDNSQNDEILPKFRSSFSWKFPVSDKIDLEHAEVDFKNGLLSISLPVINPVKKKTYLLGK